VGLLWSPPSNKLSSIFVHMDSLFDIFSFHMSILKIFLQFVYNLRVRKYSSFISPFPIIRLVSLYVILSSQSYPFTFLHCHPCGGYCFASMIQHIFADLYPLLLFVRPLLSEVALWESLLTNSFPPFFKKLFNIIRYGDTRLQMSSVFSNTVPV
jgi:hypothetical protein